MKGKPKVFSSVRDNVTNKGRLFFMNCKINKMLLLAVITTFVFVNFFGVVAMAAKHDNNSGQNTVKSRLGKGNRYFKSTRLRDCECNYECDCDGDRLELRIHKYNAQQLKELKVKSEENLAEAQKNKEKYRAKNLIMNIERINNLIKCLDDSKEDINWECIRLRDYECDCEYDCDRDRLELRICK